MAGDLRPAGGTQEPDSRPPIRTRRRLYRCGYRFIAPLTDDARNAYQELDSETDRLVGRKPELDQLGESFQKVLYGERQLVFVTASRHRKTALIDAFQRQVAADNNLRTARGQCVKGRVSGLLGRPCTDPIEPPCQRLPAVGVDLFDRAEGFRLIVNHHGPVPVRAAADVIRTTGAATAVKVR